MVVYVGPSGKPEIRVRILGGLEAYVSAPPPPPPLSRKENHGLPTLKEGIGRLIGQCQRDLVVWFGGFVSKTPT